VMILVYFYDKLVHLPFGNMTLLQNGQVETQAHLDQKNKSHF